jgi:hypothetical protein
VELSEQKNLLSTTRRVRAPYMLPIVIGDDFIDFGFLGAYSAQSTANLGRLTKMADIDYTPQAGEVKRFFNFFALSEEMAFALAAHKPGAPAKGGEVLR